MTRPLELEGELLKVDQLKAMLGDDNADLQLLLDTVEGQTNLLEMMDEILASILSDEGDVDRLKTRITRLEARSNKRRAIVLAIMERMGVKKAQRPEATLSIADGPKSVHITDEELIPMHFHRISIDKIALAKVLKEGTAVDGAQLSNGPPVLRIIR